MVMAMGETVRAKAEELRTKVRTRIEEIRGGGSSSSGGILSGNPGILAGLDIKGLKGPLVSEIRAKGLMATARARIAKFRGVTQETIPTPAGATPPVMSEKDFKVRGSRVLL